jgi:ABC-2 type transport system permease protein
VSSFAGVFSALAGVLLVTSEYRYGTIRPTILFNPVRSHVLAAKAVASALAGLAFGILGEAIGWAIGYAILDGRGITVVLSSGDILLLTLGGLAGAALWGAIGAGLGAIIHNQIGAVITLLAWGLVVDDLLFGLAPSVGRFTPTRASDALMGLRVDHLLSPGAGAITLIAWAGALAVVGIALSARQDIK